MNIVDRLSKPESVDRLALELSHIGIKVPPRDTAFFQAAVCKWLASGCDHKGRRYASIDDPMVDDVQPVRCADCGGLVPNTEVKL